MMRPVLKKGASRKMQFVIIAFGLGLLIISGMIITERYLSSYFATFNNDAAAAYIDDDDAIASLAAASDAHADANADDDDGDVSGNADVDDDDENDDEFGKNVAINDSTTSSSKSNNENGENGDSYNNYGDSDSERSGNKNMNDIDSVGEEINEKPSEPDNTNISSTNTNATDAAIDAATENSNATATSNTTATEEDEEEEMKSPSKPLSGINKDIISTAKMVDLKYVDITNGFTEFPHKGAMDEQDNFGYIHDEKALHASAPPINLSKDKINQLCGKNDGNKKMLTEKVYVDFDAHEAANVQAGIGGPPRAKIFCLVYTISKNHDRIPAIRETWGQKCDGFMVGSDVTDRELGTVHIPHEGPEEYNNIWQKVRAMWGYIYDNYYEEYDWFHIGGDDLYVIVENLRLYLESEEIQLAANGGEYLPTKKPTKQLPLLMGRRFKEKGNENRIFNSGGSGYTMNKAALKALVVDAFPTCMPHLRTSAEDVMVAQCLRDNFEVYPYDTKDELGGERYMPFEPSYHLTYKIPENKSSHWYATYSFDIKTGLDHCAAKSVAFHYIKGDLMKRMHLLLYKHCKN